LEEIIDSEIDLDEDACRYRYRKCIICNFVETQIENHRYGDDWDKLNSYLVYDHETQHFTHVFVEPYYDYVIVTDPITLNIDTCTRYKSCKNMGYTWCPKIYAEPEPHAFKKHDECERWFIVNGGNGRLHSFYDSGVSSYFETLSTIGDFDEITEWFGRQNTYLLCAAGWCDRCTIGSASPLQTPEINVWHEWEGMCRRTIVCKHDYAWNSGEKTNIKIEPCNTILYEETKPHNFIGVFCGDCGARELCIDCGGEICEFYGNCKDCYPCEHCLDCGGKFCDKCSECIDCNISPCDKCCKHSWGDWSEYVPYQFAHTRSRNCFKCGATNYDAAGHTTVTWLTSWTWYDWQWRTIEQINQVPLLQDIEITEDSCQFRFKTCVICNYLDFDIEEHTYGNDWDKRDRFNIWNDETEEIETIYFEPYYEFAFMLDSETNDYPNCAKYKRCTNYAGGSSCPIIFDEPTPHEFKLYYECEKWITLKGERRTHSFSNPNDGVNIRKLSEIGDFDDIVTWFNRAMSYMHCYNGWCSKCLLIKSPTSIRPDFTEWHEWDGMCRRTIKCIHYRAWNPYDLVYIDIDPCNTILYEETKPHSMVEDICQDCGYFSTFKYNLVLPASVTWGDMIQIW